MTGIKDSVEARFNKLLNVLENLESTLSSISGNNSEMNRIKENYINSIREIIRSINKDMKHVLEGTRWDNLVVAFFGETNAGKSTIIEIFRILYDTSRNKRILDNNGAGVDGIIIGDGSPDFTKSYDEYEMAIHGVPFTLIDVPGIEGKEDEFVKKIKRGLNQAHIVLYIQGHDKKPDTPVAENIKKYIGDWVNVYSIFNVKGSPFKYRNQSFRETIETENTINSANLIKETLTEIIGEEYKGHISIDAHAALFSIANISNQRADLKDLIKRQEKLVSLFGSKEVLMKFSNFQRLSDLISLKASNFSSEIAEANKQKFVAFAKNAKKELSNEISNDTKCINNLSNALIQYKKDIESDFTNSISNIKNKVKNKNSTLYDELYRDICAEIDTKKSKKKLEPIIEGLKTKFITNYNPSIQKIISDEIQSLAEKLTKRQKGVLDINSNLTSTGIMFSSQTSMPQMDIDLSNLSLSFSEIFKPLAGAAIGGAIGWLVGGPVAFPGALIGAGVELVGDAVFGDGGRGKAKANTLKTINNAKKSCHDIILLTNINKIENLIDTQKNKLLAAIETDQKNIYSVQTMLTNTLSEIDNQINNIINEPYGNI